MVNDKEQAEINSLTVNTCVIRRQLLKEAVVEGFHLQTTEMSDVVRRHTIVMEEPPTALVANNAVVSSPSDYRLQEFALEAEGSVGVIANGKAKEMTITRGIGEIVTTIGLVHPRSFEEAMGVSGTQRLTIGIEDDN